MTPLTDILWFPSEEERKKFERMTKEEQEKLLEKNKKLFWENLEQEAKIRGWFTI